MSVNAEAPSGELSLSALPDESFMSDYGDGTYNYHVEGGYRTSAEHGCGCDEGDGDAAPGARRTGAAMGHDGPGHNFKVSQKKFPYTFAFGVPKNGYADEPVEVTVTGEDLMELFAENAQFDPSMAHKDLRKALVTNVKLTGNTLPNNSKYAIQLFDGSKPAKPLFTQHGYKAWDSSVWRKFGYPMFNAKGTNGVLFRQPANVSEDLRRYGNMKLSDITDGVVHLSYPPSGNGQPTPPDMALVPKAKNGPYFTWALEVANNEVEDLLNNPNYQDPNNSANFRITRNMYDQVVDAYRNKLRDVRSKFHDLSSITARLVPLAQDGAAADADGSGEMTTEYVTLDFTAQLSDAAA